MRLYLRRASTRSSWSHTVGGINIPPQVTRRWLNDQRSLVLLMDGLPPDLIGSCVAEINRYVANRPDKPVAVTSRIEEYEDAVSDDSPRLALRNTVDLQPLRRDVVAEAVDVMAEFRNPMELQPTRDELRARPDGMLLGSPSALL